MTEAVKYRAMLSSVSMSAPPEESEAGSIAQLKSSRSEIRDYERIIEMLDYRQHLNVSAHLYSAHLLSLRKSKPLPGGRGRRKVPYREWTAWPRRDAPAPPQIHDEYPDEEPAHVSDVDLKELTSQSEESYPVGPSRSEAPAQVLTRAFEEYLQRVVHRNIYTDSRAENLEPLVEPSPYLDSLSASRLKQIVDKFTDSIEPSRNERSRELIGWKQLRIRGKAAARIARLLDREPREDLCDSSDEIDDPDESLTETTVEGFIKTENAEEEEEH